jgi:uncharacterized protein YyaL (SSP411 family)
MKNTVYNFRFSPNTNQAHRIDWHPWGEEAFAKAQEENKPVLLAISAVWCYWCHVMDETSYSDTDVADFMNQHFVTIRVDSDHRPDINARYNVGGWPTTAFLTGHGGFIGGATYLPPDQFLAMLGEVREAYQEDRHKVYEHARAMLRLRQEQVARVVAGPEIVRSLLDRAARTVAGAYDASNGGFGEEPKFPNTPILALLIHLARTTGEDFYRAMLRKTLDRMAESSICDKEEGGFFRYCAKADWSDVQWEKLLEDNLNLVRVYLDAWILLDNDSYRAVAERTLDYVLNHLLDDSTPAIHGSQGAHSQYFALSLSARQEQPSAPVDPSCYVGANALAVSLLLDASWMLRRPPLRELALGLLATLDTEVQEARLSHLCNSADSGDVPAFLGDWAQLLNALLAAYGHTAQEGYLERAKSVALEMVDRFVDQSNGGFFDTEADPRAVGYLRVREKPLADNLIAALGLLKLNQVTKNDDYRSLAEATLSAFVETYRDHGEFAGTYGLLVDFWLNAPVEITIEGTAEDTSTLKMLKAAAALPYPNLEIRPLLAQNFQPPAKAYICLDTVCLPPVSDSGELAETVNRMVLDKTSLIENIFQRFPGL